MLRRALAGLSVLATALVASPPAAGDEQGCPPGTSPVGIGVGVICVVVTDPGGPGAPGSPGSPGEPTHPSDPEPTGQDPQPPAGCHRRDGTEVPCETADGYWWSAHQCYAAPFDAAPDDPAWQGHTDGSLWACTQCAAAATATDCTVQILWTAPGAQPGPPSPAELAQTAFGQLPLATAEVRIAPASPAPTYVGVESWLWVPESQWTRLTKSVSAGATTVTVAADPVQVSWSVGPTALDCPGPGRAWRRGMTDAATTSCGVTFDQSSTSQPEGVFAVSASIRYAVTWTCRGSCSTASGDLGLVDAPAGSGELKVLQRQTVVVR